MNQRERERIVELAAMYDRDAQDAENQLTEWGYLEAVLYRGFARVLKSLLKEGEK